MSSPAFTSFCKCSYSSGEDRFLVNRCEHCEDLYRLDRMIDAELERELQAEDEHKCHLLDPGTAFSAGEHE